MFCMFQLHTCKKSSTILKLMMRLNLILLFFKFYFWIFSICWSICFRVKMVFRNSWMRHRWLYIVRMEVLLVDHSGALSSWKKLDSMRQCIEADSWDGKKNFTVTSKNSRQCYISWNYRGANKKSLFSNFLYLISMYYDVM